MRTYKHTRTPGHTPTRAHTHTYAQPRTLPVVYRHPHTQHGHGLERPVAAILVPVNLLSLKRGLAHIMRSEAKNKNRMI